LSSGAVANGNISIGTGANAPAKISLGQAGTKISLGEGSVTQLTNITTTVVVNASSGTITTVSASTAAQATSTFTVTNSTVSATSSIQLTGGAYSGTFGTNGTPLFYVSSVGAGTFNITIYNAHATNALAGTLVIDFAVL